MRTEASLRWSVTVMGIGGIVLFSMIIFFSSARAQAQENIDQNIPIIPTENVAVAAEEGASSRTPIRLNIPSIGIDTSIEAVGLTPDGAIGTPNNITHAAWFDRGPYPGEGGNAIIDAHFGWKDGFPGAFNNLHNIQAGDTIFVEDEKGMTTAFIVRKIETYDQNDNASEIFDSTDGKAHLNIITCEGVWNKTDKSYSDRLVVFADMK